MFRWLIATLVVLVLCFAVSTLIFRFPLSALNALLSAVLVGIMACCFGLGLLKWINYKGTADIWANNVRGRGFDSAGAGWLVDRGTIRGIGALQAIFSVVCAVSALVQVLFP